MDEDIIQIETEYGTVYIQDGFYLDEAEPIRMYRHDYAFSSATYLRQELKNELVFEYLKYYDKMFQLTDVKDILMIGGGGFQYPKYFVSHFPDANMDVVEIDKESVVIAKQYFFLEEALEDANTDGNTRLNIIIADGRTYLEETDKKYSAILNDAFSGEQPVMHLATIEAARTIQSHLEPNGVYMMNVLGAAKGDLGKFLRDELKTLRLVFRNVEVIPCNPWLPGEAYANFMIVASDGERIADETIEIEDEGTERILTDNVI